MTENKNKMHKVFVYGTLRPRDDEGALLPATHRLYGYDMYNYGRFPYIEGSVYAHKSVYGSIIEVDDEALAQLDRYEGVNKGLYRRITEPVNAIYDEGTTSAFVYVAGNIVCPQITSGDWADVAG